MSVGGVPMKRFLKGTMACAVIGLLAGCAAGQQPALDHVCTDPRPKACTRDYRPVCAIHEDGSQSTAPNGCEACADPSVTGYRDGACD